MNYISPERLLLSEYHVLERAARDARLLRKLLTRRVAPLPELDALDAKIAEAMAGVGRELDALEAAERLQAAK